MKYRPHRGSLHDAMLECVELQADFMSLIVHVARTRPDVLVNTLDVRLMLDRADDRIGWARTFVVVGSGIYRGYSHRSVIGYLDEAPWIEIEGAA